MTQKYINKENLESNVNENNIKNDIHNSALETNSNNNLEAIKNDSIGQRIIIHPENVNDFTFSKNLHLQFFRENNYDIELYGKVIDFDNYKITEYQNLLIYSYIKNNLPVGSVILQIGNDNSIVLEKIKDTYECWRINEIQDLTKNTSLDSKAISITKFSNEEIKLNNSYNYFDFVFSISSFDNLPFDKSGVAYYEILTNIHKITKTFGYSIICFSIVLKNTIVQMNSFLFSFFKNYQSNKTLNYYVDPKLIEDDTKLFYLKNDITKTEIKEDNEIVKAYSFNIFQYNILQKDANLIPSKTQSNSRSYLPKNPAFIFHHLIKCGGTSAFTALKKWFIIEFDHLIDSNEINNYSKFRFNLENITSDTCIVGHYAQEGAFVYQRYPEIITRKDEIKSFTFIRDPLTFSTSFYYYTLGKGRFNNIKLIQHLEFQKNFLAKFLTCNESNYKEVLDQYFFIGITERMQESFDKLAKILNKRKIKVPFVNKSEKDSQLSEITPEFIETFKKNNKLDYKIYDYCLQKFEKI